jgi:hypothetical protein
METYLALLAGLLAWAAIVWAVVAYNEWSEVAGALATLIGYVLMTQSAGVPIALPTTGGVLERLVEVTFTDYGLVGVAALVGGGILGYRFGSRQRQPG